MLKQMIRRLASGGGAARGGRRTRRNRRAPGGTGATVGAMVERFLRRRR